MLTHCLTFRTKKGYSRYNYPRHWHEVGEDVYSFYTQNPMAAVTILLGRKEVLEVTLHHLATNEFSVYSSKHAEQIRSATTPINVNYYVIKQPEKLSWLRLLFSTKKPKT